MCATPVSPQDCPPGLVPSAPWRIEALEVHPGFRIHLRFMDGTSGFVDCSARVGSQDAGVFAKLSDPHLFNQAHLVLGAVTWPGDLDLAPDVLWAEIAAHGECRLT